MAKATKNAPAAVEEKAKPAKAEKPKREASEKSNGIARPKADTVVGKIWAIADGLSNLKLKTPKIAPRKDVLTAAENEGINPSTAATQYGRWRRFHGIKGRSDMEQGAE